MKFPVLKFKCPQCGKRHVHPSDKILSATGIGVPVGKKGFTLNSNYVNSIAVWRCDDCGHEFRDVNTWYQSVMNQKEFLDHPLNKYTVPLLILLYFVPFMVLSIPALFLLMALEGPATLLIVIYTALYVFFLRYILKKARRDNEIELQQVLDLAEKCCDNVPD